MATQSPPLVSLQAPKDVSVSEVEAELGKIWQSYNSSGDAAAPIASRASTFSLIVYEPEETQQLLAILGFYTGPVDGIGGPRTEAALRTAQQSFGLPVTGKADAATLAKLREAFMRHDHHNGNAEGGNGSSSHYAVDARGAGVADAIASQNPCRIIALCPTHGEDEGVTAQVSAYCPIQKQSRSSLICCEYITLKGTEEALQRVGSMVNSLMIADLPKFLWWKATPDPNNELFQQLAQSCNSVIVDSSFFLDPEADLLNVIQLLEQGVHIADLNWRRLAAWQELAAEAFDPPERRASLGEVDQVTIDYEKGNMAQSLMYLGWLASRLQWKPVSVEEEKGDYDVTHIHMVAADQRPIKVELAGVPITESGEIAGDLLGLRLTSTNLQADCCTILCSETTGCMRMEAGGGAQSCRVNQVTALADQKPENLLSQQLLRWGREMLYEESIAVVGELLRL